MAAQETSVASGSDDEDRADPTPQDADLGDVSAVEPIGDEGFPEGSGDEAPPPAEVIETIDIPLGEIRLGENVRPTPASIEELAETLRIEGQLQPCRVRRLTDAEMGDAGQKGGQEGSGTSGSGASGSGTSGSDSDAARYELIFGSRRYVAAQSVGWETVRCEVIEGPPSDALLHPYRGQQLTENTAREALEPLDLAREIDALRRSTDPPLTYERIGKRLGIGKGQISSLLKLLTKLCPAGQEALESKRIGISVAEEGVRLPDDEQEKFVRNAIKQQWSVHKAHQYVDRVLSDRVKAAEEGITGAGDGGDDGDGTDHSVGLVVTLPISDAPRLHMRDDLSPAEERRACLYALLCGGMDADLTLYIEEAYRIPYEGLWDGYVARLSDDEVEALLKAVTRRWYSSAARFPLLSQALREFYAIPGSLPVMVAVGPPSPAAGSSNGGDADEAVQSVTDDTAPADEIEDDHDAEDGEEDGLIAFEGGDGDLVLADEPSPRDIDPLAVPVAEAGPTEADQAVAAALAARPRPARRPVKPRAAQEA